MDTNKRKAGKGSDHPFYAKSGVIYHFVSFCDA